MREIEIKAHVRSGEKLIEELQKLGCEIGKPIRQEDVVYVRKAGSMEEFLGNDLFLRIRATDGKIIFTLKYHPDRTQNGNSLSMPVEHELEVSNRAELESMLTLLGFSPALTIVKDRRTAHYNDWEICLDAVEELGDFIEVEQLIGHDDEVAPVSEAITEFLASLEVAPSDIGVKRYDIQMLERRFRA